MAGTKDKYGIPPGGNNGVYGVHKWAGIDYTLPWQELMGAIAWGGWPQKDWATAGAVAAAESSRNPFIYNTYKMGHFGLFQISRSAWPDFFAASNANGGMGWCAPNLNAQYGYKIFQQQGWKAWSSYTNGSYLAYLPAAKAAANHLVATTGVHGGDEKGYWASLASQKTITLYLKAVGVTAADIAGVATSGIGTAITGAANATADATVSSGGDVASSVNAQFGWLPDLWTELTTPALWMRVGYGALGIILVAGGLFMIVKNRPVVQKAASAAMNVVPGGKVAAAVKGAA